MSSEYIRQMQFPLSQMTPKQRLQRFLEDQNLWPQWPYLPVTRIDAEKHEKLYGVIVFVSAGKFALWRNAIMFLSRETWEDHAVLSVEEIVAEGWEVD